jgi:general secretion pathway protein K
LQEAKLSSFLRTQSNSTTSTASDSEQDESLTDQVFLSGQITDLQSKLNFYNLFLAANSNTGNLSPVSLNASNSNATAGNNTFNGNGNATTPQGATLSFIRLFEVLNLPVAELQSVNAQLQLLSQSIPKNGATSSSTPTNNNLGSATLLMPQRFEQLSWLGLSESSIRRLLPHATWLPFASTININTASAEVLYASLPGLDLSGAQRLVKARENKPWQNMDQFKSVLNAQNKPLALNDSNYQLASKFFEVKGQIRIGNTIINEKSVLLRDNSTVQIIWRDKGSAIRFLDPASP